MVVIDTFKKIHDGHYAVQHNLNTRNRNQAIPKFHRLARCQQSITYNGPTEWNILPDDLRNITSLPVFKHRLKHFYLSKYSMSY